MFLIHIEDAMKELLLKEQTREIKLAITKLQECVLWYNSRMVLDRR